MTRPVTTPAGRRRLDERLREAERRYGAVVADNPEAAESGDTSVWHDNFAYEENQRQMHQWARRVRDLRALLARLEVVSPPLHPTRAALGCAVTLADARTDAEQRLVLAGFEDGDPAAGRVSYTSPLGGALLGARVGDVLAVRVGGAEREVTVLAIERAEED